MVAANFISPFLPRRVLTKPDRAQRIIRCHARATIPHGRCILALRPGFEMGKLISCWIAVALGLIMGIRAQAQTPAVAGVADDQRLSPMVDPGSIGYVFGSGFGTAVNTTVTVGGLKAQVLEVSSTEIRALFPASLPAGFATLTVTV